MTTMTRFRVDPTEINESRETQQLPYYRVPEVTCNFNTLVPEDMEDLLLSGVNVKAALFLQLL